MLPRTALALALAPAFALLAACGGPSPASDAGARDAAASDGAPFDGTPEQGRAQCVYGAGDRVARTLGLDDAARAAIPLTHVVVVMQENRSFDHYFGRLPAFGLPEVDGIPAGYTNPDRSDRPVAPAHASSTCILGDPPHQWAAMHASWDHGAMDAFLRTASFAGLGADVVLGYYERDDLPFYYWLANTYATSDRYFGATLGGTWANRDYLYAGTSDGVMNTGDRALTDVRTVFDELDDAQVTWGVYTDGGPRQDSLGWNRAHRGVGSFQNFLDRLADGSLPAVTFVDPGPGQDEHPAGTAPATDIQLGEAWSRRIYLGAVASPLWPHLAVIYTYDESGGFFDHVPPPPACIPSPDQTAFDTRGIRVPVVVVSPWARPHSVSHLEHDHTSVLRLIELLHDLPALTARDANADALLDLFDFTQPALMAPPDSPASGTGGCP